MENTIDNENDKVALLTNDTQAIPSIIIGQREYYQLQIPVFLLELDDIFEY